MFVVVIVVTLGIACSCAIVGTIARCNRAQLVERERQSHRNIEAVATSASCEAGIVVVTYTSCEANLVDDIELGGTESHAYCSSDAKEYRVVASLVEVC
jgi:hypothetical protein